MEEFAMSSQTWRQIDAYASSLFASESSLEPGCESDIIKLRSSNFTQMARYKQLNHSLVLRVSTIFVVDYLSID